MPSVGASNHLPHLLALPAQAKLRRMAIYPPHLAGARAQAQFIEAQQSLQFECEAKATPCPPEKCQQILSTLGLHDFSIDVKPRLATCTDLRYLKSIDSEMDKSYNDYSMAINSIYKVRNSNVRIQKAVKARIKEIEETESLTTPTKIAQALCDISDIPHMPEACAKLIRSAAVLIVGNCFNSNGSSGKDETSSPSAPLPPGDGHGHPPIIEVPEEPDAEMSIGKRVADDEAAQLAAEPSSSDPEAGEAHDETTGDEGVVLVKIPRKMSPTGVAKLSKNQKKKIKKRRQA